MEKRDKDGNGEVCFDVERISVVYSEAFHQLLRLSAGFLPLFFPPLPVPRKLCRIDI